MLEPGNLVRSSAPGCHIAGAGGDPSSAWVLARRRFSRRSLGLRKADAVPDISLEPQSKTLMFLNPSDGANKAAQVICERYALGENYGCAAAP